MTTLETLKQSLERTRPASIDVEVVETPAEEAPVPDRTTIGALVELILKRHRALDTLIRDQTRQSELIPQLLTIAIAGFVMYGVMMGLTIGFSAIRPD